MSCVWLLIVSYDFRGPFVEHDLCMDGGELNPI